MYNIINILNMQVYCILFNIKKYFYLKIWKYGSETVAFCTAY